MVAFVTFGFGVNEADGAGVGVGDDALLQAGMASPRAIAPKSIKARLGMAGSVTRPSPAPFRTLGGCLGGEVAL